MLPAYEDVEIDSSRFVIDTLPKRPHMNYYNTFTVLQEMLRAFGYLDLEKDDHWSVKDNIWNSGERIAQDPYKRLTFGRTLNDLKEGLSRVNKVIDDGVMNADAFIFTFGMAEVFKNKNNNLVVAQKPLYMGGGGDAESEVYLSSFKENKDNVQKLVDIIRTEKENNAKIFLSVSPVPLERTFSGKDVYIANSAGKSLLRTVLEEVSRENNDVYYFPSWDLIHALGADAFISEDGRHVKSSVVEYMVECFVRSYIY